MDVILNTVFCAESKLMKVEFCNRKYLAIPICFLFDQIIRNVFDIKLSFYAFNLAFNVVIDVVQYKIIY